MQTVLRSDLHPHRVCTTQYLILMARHLAEMASGLLLLALQAHSGLTGYAASTSTEYVVVTTTHNYIGDIITTTRTVKTWLTLTAHPEATSSSINEYLDLEVVQLYLPAGSVGEWQLSTDPPLSLEPGDDDGETST